MKTVRWDAPFSNPKNDSNERRAKSHRWIVPLVLVTLIPFWFWGGGSGTNGGWTGVHCQFRLARAPEESSSKGVKWTGCGENMECTRIEVPMDYKNASVGTVSLSVGRYLATVRSKERLGSVFVNPGGPGGSGLSFLYRSGRNVSAVLGGKYDVVSWDPRGINGTTPQVKCFDSQTDQQLFSLNIMTPDARNWSDPISLAVYEAAYRSSDALRHVSSQLCQEKSNDTPILSYVGTTYVVQDMERLSSIIEGPDVPVNYWGFSYGTAVGSYFVNMFPDRVGRVIIDGNIDPWIWSNVHETEWMKLDLVDTEKALDLFYSFCVKAGPGNCDLASPGLTEEYLAATIDTFLYNLYDNPLPVPHAKRGGILTPVILKSILFTAMYRPRAWPELAQALKLALEGNATSLMDQVMTEVELDPSIPPRTEYAIDAVTCMDTPPWEFKEGEERHPGLSYVIEEAQKAAEVAPHFGGIDFTACYDWKVKPVDRFTGPWNHTLSNPILIIGNTADPITPLINAQASNTYLGSSSRLIIQNSPGHCSSAMSSLCTAKYIRNYFEKNELPPDGIQCEVDEDVFAPKMSALAHLEGQMAAEDRELMEAWMGMGEVVGQFTGRMKRSRWSA